MDRFQGCFTALKKLKNKELSPAIKVVFNVILLILIGPPVLIYATAVSPNERGFYCNDASLSYPLLQSTISSLALIIGGITIPIVVILIVEIIRDSSNDKIDESFKLNCLPQKAIVIFTTIGYFLFGCGCIQTITDLAKYNIGRLRPHFHAACQTDWSAIQQNCSITTHPVYIYPIPCLNDDLHRIRDARLSFFSGHASFSAYTMIYLIFYLDHRITWLHPKLLKPFIQFLCLLLAIYTSMSRIFDYYHHWSDVLFGFIMGAIMAYLIARYVSKIIVSNKKQELKEDDGIRV